MENKKKVAFYTLGCKLNFSETSTIARNFGNEGFERVDFEEVADIYVINTCSVTENADKQFKQVVRKAMKLNDKAFVAAVGCYAQLKPEELAAVDGVDLVLGATEKFKITDYLNDLSKNDFGKVHSCEIAEADFYVGSYSFGDRTRAFLKVQDGCDYNCSFCTIPMARGKSRSDEINNILENVKTIATGGAKEIVLTGINLGDFGKGDLLTFTEGEGKAAQKKHSENFFDLIKELDEIPGIERYRISSIEPNLLSNEIIEFVSNSKHFMPHFHIPLQSGSNKTLAAMRRRYRSELYAEKVRLIKLLMPHCCIGVDVIVGFPGETDEDFQDTVDFLTGLDISYLHVFTYSERDNTHALTLGPVVPVHVRHERNKILRNLSYEKMQSFTQEHIGETRKVLFESVNKNGMMEGYSDNYIKITTPYKKEWENEIVDWQI